MIDELKHIVGGNDMAINDKIIIHNPTIYEVMRYGEFEYISDLSSFIIRPYDAMVALDDVGIDYRTISNYDFFLMTFDSIHDASSLLMPDMDFKSFRRGVNPDNGEPILYDSVNGIMIDRLVYEQITEYIRAIHFIRADVEYDVGNEFARQMLLKKKRRELKKKKPFEAQYPSIISSLVNNANFKYDYSSVMNLHVSQLWDAFYRINKLINYQNTMIGVYTGNVDAVKLDKSAIGWFNRIDVNAQTTMDNSSALTPT